MTSMMFAIFIRTIYAFCASFNRCERRKTKMLVSYEWLSQYVDLAGITPEEMAQALNRAGIEVEEVFARDQGVAGKDHVLHLQLTPNRSDCLGMLGVAYEVAALFDRELTLPTASIQSAQAKRFPVKITLASEEDCPLYAVQVVHACKGGLSPQWLQNRLSAVGIRPVNNVVDITNYVMIETGQPLHAFAYEQTAGGNLLVRRAYPQETIVTLDGVRRECDAETLLITDGNEPLALAGVMGGESSEVTATTTSVLLEAAFFHPASIRKTVRRLRLRSEASHRFEKGVDPGRVIPALARAVQLLQQVAGGIVGSDLVVKGVEDIDDRVVTLRHERLLRLLGIQMGQKEVLDIFRRLRFPVTLQHDVYQVQVPSRRPDISIEADLIEEAARMVGYDRIPAILPWGQLLLGGFTQEQRWRRMIRHIFCHLGMHEVVTYSLISEHAAAEVSGLGQAVAPIHLQMPMSHEHAVLRTSLLPQLLRNAQYNRNYGNVRVEIFEMGRTYIASEKPLSCLPEERWELAGLVVGATEPTLWKQPEKVEDFFVVKGRLEVFFTRLGIRDVTFQTATMLAGFHPGRAAELQCRGEVMGVMGQLHPRLAQAHDLGDTVVFQLDLAKVFAAWQEQITYVPIPRFPAVMRDVALIVEEDVAVSQVEAGIRDAAKELLESVTLFDVFTGAQLDKGKKSIAFSIIYRAKDRTLTDDEVQVIHRRVVSYLAEMLGAKLRSS
jgi:phenylalanyl-tRNA synthetase beta chain